MHLEEFAEGSTVLHRLDPRTKFLAGMPLVISTALVRGIEGALACLVMGIMLCIVGRLEPGKLAIRLLAVNAFIFMLWIFLPFTVEGRELFSIGSLSATLEGVAQAALITLKANAIALMSIAIFGTSEAMSLAHGLVHLYVPEKLVHLFFFFYRYLGVLHEEYSRLRGAMRLRCFRASNSRHTYQSLGYLIGMLVVRSYERSGRIYNAMLCRGFHGHFPVVAHFHFHRADGVFAAIWLILAGGLLILWS